MCHVWSINITSDHSYLSFFIHHLVAMQLIRHNTTIGGLGSERRSTGWRCWRRRTGNPKCSLSSQSRVAWAHRLRSRRTRLLSSLRSSARIGLILLIVRNAIWDAVLLWRTTLRAIGDTTIRESEAPECNSDLLQTSKGVIVSILVRLNAAVLCILTPIQTIPHSRQWSQGTAGQCESPHSCSTLRGRSMRIPIPESNLSLFLLHQLKILITQCSISILILFTLIVCTNSLLYSNR